MAKKIVMLEREMNIFSIFVIAMSGGLSAMGLVNLLSKQYITGVLEIMLSFLIMLVIYLWINKKI